MILVSPVEQIFNEVLHVVLELLDFGCKTSDSVVSSTYLADLNLSFLLFFSASTDHGHVFKFV